MDEAANPYCPGAGWPPVELAGREEEIRQFQLLLQRLAKGRHHRSQIITGLRGVGKTVLLGEFNKMATEAEWFVARHEMEEDQDFRTRLGEISRQLLLEMSAHPRLRGFARRALGVLKSFSLKPALKASLDGSIELSLGVEAVEGRGDSGNLSQDLGDLFLEMGALAKKRGTGVVFLFDEVQGLKKADLIALITALHRAHQDQLPVSLVAAGLPQLPKLAAEAKSYSERLFVFPVVGALSKTAGEAALVVPAALEKLTEEKLGELVWEPDAIEMVRRESEWFPYFIQEWGSVCWNVAPGPHITLADVEKAKPTVLTSLDQSFFRVRDSRLTPRERRTVRAMASLGDGPYRPRDILAALGISATGGLSEYRDRLIRKGMIYSPSYGELGFTVPHFADYIRRKYPPWKVPRGKSESLLGAVGDRLDRLERGGRSRTVSRGSR